jgi:hypothetical protein
MEVDRFADLRRAVDALVDADPAALSTGEDVLAALTQLARLDAFACRQAAAFDEDPLWPLTGAHGSDAWVATRRRCPRRVTKKRRRLGHALRNMALIEAAWLAGDIGLEHVEVLVGARSPKLAKAFTRDEAELLGYATEKSFREFRQKVAYWVLENAPDDAEDKAQSQREQRKLHHSQSFESMWFMNGTFDPISGQIIADELARLEKQLFEQDWADAKATLGRDPHMDELARTPQQRRADAMVEMAKRSATMPKNGRAPKPLFTVLVGEASFARVCELAAGTVITPGSLVPHLTKAQIERIVFDGPKRVIEVSHRRCFTGAMRRAIQVRDRVCDHEYCEEPAEHCQIDHIDPAANGGPTSLDNGRALCGYHNRLRNNRTDNDDDPDPPHDDDPDPNDEDDDEWDDDQPDAA